ncbi:hypothetical protein D8M21_05225 [Kocuria sp. HSID16901]|nr:hypothetical protein D8M21_05225 [Kocuria sp. HSID16901]
MFSGFQWVEEMLKYIVSTLRFPVSGGACSCGYSCRYFVAVEGLGTEMARTDTSWCRSVNGLTKVKTDGRIIFGGKHRLPMRSSL